MVNPFGINDAAFTEPHVGGSRPGFRGTAARLRAAPEHEGPAQEIGWPSCDEDVSPATARVALARARPPMELLKRCQAGWARGRRMLGAWLARAGAQLAGSPEMDLEADATCAAAAPSERTLRLAMLRQASAYLPGLLFELEQKPGGHLVFTFLTTQNEELWDLSPGNATRDAETLRGCVDSAHQESFERSLREAAAERSPWVWEGRCMVRGRTRWVQAMGRLQASPAGRCIWSGVFLDCSKRESNEMALERCLADLTEMGTKERLRAEVLGETCERLTLRNRQLISEQEAVVKAEKNAALLRLALGLAHEINNPLAGVIYMFEALQGGALPDERREDYLRNIEAGLWRVQATTRSLLQYAQPTPSRTDACDWFEVIEQARARVQAALAVKQQTLALQLKRGQAVVLGDAGMLAQALSCVLLNAIHASPMEATIAVDARRQGQRVGLQVRDTGTGIPSEYLHRVCDPFFTTKQQGEGTGLGLATTARTLENQQGELVIASEEGRGTCVELWLPAWAAA